MKPSDIEAHVRCIDLDRPVEVVQVPPGGSGPRGAILFHHAAPGGRPGAFSTPDPRTSAQQLGTHPLAMPMEGGKPKGPAVARERRELTFEASAPVAGLKCSAAGAGGTQILVLDRRPEAGSSPLRVSSRAAFGEVLSEAMARTRELATADPSWPLPRKILDQLEGIQASLQGGAVPGQEQRFGTELGPIAVRNFVGSYDGYADLLMELDYAYRRYDALL